MSVLRDALEFATTPSTFLLLLACLAFVALVAGWRRGAVWGLGSSVAGFLVFGFTSLSEVMVAPLVTRFPPVDLATAEPPFGLIVLGADVNEVHAAYNGALMELGEGPEIIPTAALLAQRYPEARIILSGGTGTPFPAAPQRATDGMRRILMAFGVADDRIAIDPNSPTTALRAVNTLALVGADRDRVWWVITPAHRMPRLMGAYRRIGFDPVPYPVDFQWIPPFSPTYLYGFTEGLVLTDTGAKEWRGLLLYYLTGRIDTLFPGP